MNVNENTCFKRLQIAKSKGSPYFVVTIELIGDIQVPIWGIIRIFGFECIVISTRRKPSTTEVVAVTKGWLLNHIKCSRTLIFTTMNEGNVFALKHSTTSLEPDTLLIYNTDISPWADSVASHFYASQVLNIISKYLFYHNKIINDIYTNFDYAIKDFQFQQGSTILNAIKNIYNFGENDLILFLDNDILYINVFPQQYSLLDILPEACLLGVITQDDMIFEDIIAIGLQGRTGIWFEKEQRIGNEELIFLEVLPQHESTELHKKVIHYKYKRSWKKIHITTDGESIYLDDSADKNIIVSIEDYLPDLQQYILDLTPKYIFNFEDVSMPETPIYNNEWIDDHIITSFDYNVQSSGNYPIFSILEELIALTTGLIYARDHITVYEETKNIYIDEVPDINSYELKDTYIELPVVRTIRAINPENIFTYFIKERSGNSEINITKVNIIDHFYFKVGNLLIRDRSKKYEYTMCIEVPNYDTNFLFNPWNLATTTRFIDLTEPSQRDVEDILVTMLFYNLTSVLDMYTLLLILDRPTLASYIKSERLNVMKDHPLIKKVVEHEFPQDTAIDMFIRRAARVILNFFSIVKDIEPPIALVLYAEEGIHGWSIDNFEQQIISHPLYNLIYNKLKTFINSLNKNIRFRLFQISDTIFTLFGKGKASKIDINRSYTFDKRKRIDTSQEIIESDRIFIQLKPRTHGSIQTLSPLDITDIIRIPTNNISELYRIYSIYKTYQQSHTTRSYSLLYTKEQLNGTFNFILNYLSKNALEFSMSIDNTSGLVQIDYIINESEL